MTTSLTAPLTAPGVRLAALEEARPARLSWPRGTGYPAAGALQRHEVSERSTRLATAAAVGVALVFPPLQVFRIFTFQGGPGPARWALLAVALYLPLHVRHVWFAAHTRRPPAGAWTLAAMAVIVIGALPLINSAWTLEFSWLAISVLMVMPRPWSYLAMLTGLSQPGNLLRALKVHVRGFITKDAPAQTLADGVRRVARGERVIDPELIGAALETGASPLTAREADVLRAAETGIPTDQIATQLSLSRATVRNYLSNAISKVGARNRIDAIRISRNAGWL
jgi:DNA-binding CsgD family transcriptional regulator